MITVKLYCLCACALNKVPRSLMLNTDIAFNPEGLGREVLSDWSHIGMCETEGYRLCPTLLWKEVWILTLLVWNRGFFFQSGLADYIVFTSKDFFRINMDKLVALFKCLLKWKSFQTWDLTGRYRKVDMLLTLIASVWYWLKFSWALELWEKTVRFEVCSCDNECEIRIKKILKYRNLKPYRLFHSNLYIDCLLKTGKTVISHGNYMQDGPFHSIGPRRLMLVSDHRFFFFGFTYEPR